MSTQVQVLQFFTHAKGQFVSGTDIGDKLGLSRVSIHNHLEALKKDGFEFSAIRNRGYRLEKEPDYFHPGLFAALMEIDPCPFFKSYQAYEEVGSTNSLAELELARGTPGPFFIIANEQTEGRGRRGRTWHSPMRKNLYLSIGLRPEMPPAKLQTITLWMGLRLCKFLREKYALPVLIKWPNDLILHDRKVAGMLTEARVDSEFTRDLVFGLGLNVNADKDDFPNELADVATSLCMNLQREVNLTRLAQSIVTVLSSAITDYLDGQFAGELADEWPEYDYLRGQDVHAADIQGRVIGISANGSLRLERPDGSHLLLHSGEVSIGSGKTL